MVLQTFYKTVYIYLFKSQGDKKLVIQKAEIRDGEWVSEEEALSRVGYKGAKSITRRAIAHFKKSELRLGSPSTGFPRCYSGWFEGW